MAGDSIRVNGNQYSWGSIKAKLDGVPYFGFKGITYADKRERVKAYGMGKHQAPRGRSRGKYSTENSKLTGPKSSIQLLREALAAKSSDGVSYGDVEFEVVFQYVERDELPITVQLERCVIVGNSSSEEEGADPLNEEIELDVMKIYRNGLTLFDSSEGSP
jgi:hypothetical protein